MKSSLLTVIPNPKALLIKAFLPARNAQAQAGEAEAWVRKSDPKCVKIYIMLFLSRNKSKHLGIVNWYPGSEDAQLTDTRNVRRVDNSTRSAKLGNCAKSPNSSSTSDLQQHPMCVCSNHRTDQTSVEPQNTILMARSPHL
jgi:hypothetical protein